MICGEVYSREFGGWGYAEIQEGRWCPAIDLALVCNSMAPVTRSESSPELWKMASLVPRPRVNGLQRSLPREELRECLGASVG